MLGIIRKGDEEAREQASLAVWGLVLGGGGGQAGVDGIERLLGAHDEEAVIAVLEGLGTFVEGSEGKQRAYVERFGVGRVVGLLGHGSAGVQFIACGAVVALSSDCESNRDAFVEGGVAEHLVRLLESDDAEVQDGALAAICMIVNEDNNSSRKDAFCSAGAAAAISQLLQSPVEAVQGTAAMYIAICASQHVKSQDAFHDAGCVPLLVGLLSSSSAEVQNMSCEAILKLSEWHRVNAAAFCDWGAIPMLLELITGESGDAREQACSAVWGLVLGGGGGQAGVDGMKSLLVGRNEAAVIAVLEGLGTFVEGSEEKQLAFVEQFGNGWVLSLLRSSSAGVRLKAILMKLATTLHGTFTLALNRVSHQVAKSNQVAKSEASYNRGNQWMDHNGCIFPKKVDFCRQCPKGHTLVRLDTKNDGLRLMCRLCHVTGDRDQSNWMVCLDHTEENVGLKMRLFACICCGRYAVCPSCSQRSASVLLNESSENMCTLVRDYYLHIL